MDFQGFLMKIRKIYQTSYLAKNTIVLSTGTGLRTLCQTFVFLILVRVLGAKDYGAYAAVLAIACSLGSLGGFGTQIVLVRDVSRNQETFNKAWGLVLASIILGTPFLLGTYLFFSWVLLPQEISWTVIILIGLAELVLAPLSAASAYAYQGHERMGRTSRLMLLPVIPRLLSALLLIVFAMLLPADMYLTAWSTLYATSALFAAVYALRLVHRDLGLPIRLNFTELIWYMRQGIAFAIGGVAQKLYVDIDKTMLASLTNLEITGSYSAGYRVVDMVTIPLRSMLTSTIPQFFRAGKQGTDSTIDYAVKLLPWPLIYAFVSGVVLFFSAKTLTFILGTGYEQAVQVLQYLAWLPLLSIPRLFIQTALSTGGLQGTVVAALALGSLSNIFLNLWLIPQSGWLGAIAATYAAEILIVTFMIVIIYLKKKAV